MNQDIPQQAAKAVQEELRTCLLDLKTLSNIVNRGVGGREISLAYTNLQQSEAWLRQALQEMVDALHD